LTGGCSIAAAQRSLTAAMKEAGIIATTSVSKLKAAREWVDKKLAKTPINTFRDMRQFAEKVVEKVDGINTDPEKALKAAMKIVREAMEAKKIPVPRKIQLGLIKGMMVDYFLDAHEQKVVTSTQGLADYLVANVPGGGKDATDEMKKKLKITAGTDYNFGYLLVNGLRLKDIN